MFLNITMSQSLLIQRLRPNDIQSQILTITFKIADENDLLLIDTKDLKSMLNYFVKEENLSPEEVKELLALVEQK